jgi:hypothetical protein
LVSVLYRGGRHAERRGYVLGHETVEVLAGLDFFAAAENVDRDAVFRHGEQAVQEAATTQQAKDEADKRLRDVANTAGQTATAAQANVFRIAETAATGAQRVVTDAAQCVSSDFRTVASLPAYAVGTITEFRAAWLKCIGQTALAGTEMSQKIVRQAAEQQRQFAADAVQAWMERNARIMQFALRIAQEGFRPL